MSYINADIVADKRNPKICKRRKPVHPQSAGSEEGLQQLQAECEYSFT